MEQRAVQCLVFAEPVELVSDLYMHDAKSARTTRSTDGYTP